MRVCRDASGEATEKAFLLLFRFLLLRVSYSFSPSSLYLLFLLSYFVFSFPSFSNTFFQGEPFHYQLSAMAAMYKIVEEPVPPLPVGLSNGIESSGHFFSFV